VYRFKVILEKVLPAWWMNRIDLEGASIRRFVASAAELTAPGSNVLDSGAGQCPYRAFFRNTRYFGIDFAKGESNWNYGNLDVVGKLEFLPFKTGVFDAVLSTQVLEHVAEPEWVIRETFRVLKPNGKLFLSAPLGFGEHQQPFDFYRYTRFGIRHLLEKTGFNLISIEPRGGYFFYMAVMSMWFYIYLFPNTRHILWKSILFPLQFLGALFFLVLWPTFLSCFDFLDKEKSITLGFAVIAEKPETE